MNFKKLRVGRNPNHSFEERTHGGSRRIVGRKVLWFQTSFGLHPLLCVCVRLSPKVTSRRGFSEKGLAPKLIDSPSVKGRSRVPLDLHPEVKGSVFNYKERPSGSQRVIWLQNQRSLTRRSDWFLDFPN
jgi:hypothetical protein